MASPILKWAGGKRQLLDDLHDRFPLSYAQYHEPFLGGGAVFFDLEPTDGTVNDTNPRLIDFYEQVRDRPEELIETARSFDDPEAPPDTSREFATTDRSGNPIEDYYYQQRALFNRRPEGEEYDSLEEASLLLYLNRTGYNGLYRENSRGGFNVPIGRYNDPDWVRAREIREASGVLERTGILNRDFEYVLDCAENGDLVYFDPPYEPMSQTASFTDYSAAGFGWDDQERLLEAATELDQRGVWVVLSNSGVMYDIYDGSGFHVETEGATRAINSDGENRDEVEEIIATNVPVPERRNTGQRGLAEF